MSNICCNAGLLNYGRGQCTTQIAEVVGTIAVSTYDSDGVRNAIDLTSDFGSTQVEALLINADKKARWIPFPRLYGVSLPIADTVFDEATDGTKSFVREGVWSLSAEVRDKDAVAPVQKRLKSTRCADLSFFLVTKDNQLVGRVSKDGTKLYPLDINSGSIDAKMMFRDAQATNKIMFACDFDNLIKQEDLYVLEGENLTTAVDFLRLQKLTDATLTLVSNTTTTIVAGAKTSFAQGLVPNNDLVGYDSPSDWVLTNLTTGLAVTISSVTESPTIDGEYTFTFTAQTAGDVLELKPAIGTTFLDGVLEVTAA